MEKKPWKRSKSVLCSRYKWNMDKNLYRKASDWQQGQTFGVTSVLDAEHWQKRKDKHGCCFTVLGQVGIIKYLENTAMVHPHLLYASLAHVGSGLGPVSVCPPCNKLITCLHPTTAVIGSTSSCNPAWISCPANGRMEWRTCHHVLSLPEGGDKVEQCRFKFMLLCCSVCPVVSTRSSWTAFIYTVGGRLCNPSSPPSL